HRGRADSRCAKRFGVLGLRGRRFRARLAGGGAELQPPGSPAWRHVGPGRAAADIKRGSFCCQAERRRGRSGGLVGGVARDCAGEDRRTQTARRPGRSGGGALGPHLRRNQLFSDWSVCGLSCERTGSEEHFCEWYNGRRPVPEHLRASPGRRGVGDKREGQAQHAAEIGADGIAVIAPFFLKPWTKDILINFLKEVAAAAPALPFYYYHIPALTGVKIRAEELLDGIQDKIPTFQGLKFSDTDLLDFGQCVDQNRQQQFAFLFGVDEQLLSALVMGATGAVGSTYNYLGKKTNQMLEAFERKDLSLALNYQFCIQRFINFVVKLGFGVSQTKAIMTLVSGIPMGPPRLPLQKASREFTDSAEAKLKSLDFLSFTDLKDGSLEASS
uniref:N-acetylneuraminate lyase n=1 Tax=Piliocolobus tephrosceles TaxID=591936 RepID=A0A8C9GCI1_9PRIM